MRNLGESIALLERAYANLRTWEHARDFFLHLRPFVERLERDPMLRGHLDDMASDVQREHERFLAIDAQLIGRLREIRARVPRLPVDDAEDDSFAFRHGLRSFDSTAQQSEPSIRDRVTRHEETLRAKRLAFLLRCRLEHAWPRNNEGPVADPVVEQLFHDFNAVEADVKYEARHIRVFVETSGCVAFAKLRDLLRQLNPPRADDTDASREQWVHDYVARIVGDPSELLNLLYRESSPDMREIERARSAARELVQLVYEELRERVGTTRTMLSLVLRFKQRAESFDAEALRAIAQDERGQKEDRLADRLAAFLFDQGLTPRTRAMASGLVPDIVAADLYIEAKQYGDRDGATKAVRDGVKQIWDTAPRLRTATEDVREAFLVIFKRGGPMIVFEQELVRSGGLALHALVIDVTPGDEAGSSQAEKPVLISADSLAPKSTR